MKPLQISLSNAMSWQGEWCLGVLALIDSGLIRIVACYLHFFTTFQVWTIMILKKLTNKNIHDYHLGCCWWFYLFLIVFFATENRANLQSIQIHTICKTLKSSHNNNKKNRTKQAIFFKI